MSKFASLQAGLNRAAGRAEPPAAPPTPTPDTAARPAAAKTSSREGKVHVGAYLPDGFRRGVRLVQAQTGEDTQTLVARALNELFRFHNVPVVDVENYDVWRL